jgi:hypothetical protein
MKPRNQLALFSGTFGLLVVAGFALVASQLLPVSAVDQALPATQLVSLPQQQQPLPTPRGPITKVPPNLPPLPTLVGGRPNVTPTLIPATKVRLGQVREIPPGEMLPLLDKTLFAIPGQPTTDKYPVVTQDSTRRYQVRTKLEPFDPNQHTFVEDLQTGQITQLGHNQAPARPVAMTDEYVLWTFRGCDSCELHTPHSGLYIYDWHTGTSTLLTEDLSGKRDYKADGRWIGYVKIKDTRNCFGELYVMNVDTMQEQFVDASVPWECDDYKGYFALSNNRVVWARAGAAGPGKWGLGLLDLTTGQQRDLRIPDVGKPTYVSFSGDYILIGLFGYDLRQDAVFNFSLTVPGWENIVTRSGSVPVVKNDNVYWGQSVSGQAHYFVAPLVRVTNP